MIYSIIPIKYRSYYEEYVKQIPIEDCFIYATTLLLSLNIFTLFLYLYEFSQSVISSEVGKDPSSSGICAFIFESIISTRLNVWDFIYLATHQLYALINGEFSVLSIVYLMYLLLCKISSASRVPKDLIGASISIQSFIVLQFLAIIFEYKLNEGEKNSSDQDEFEENYELEYEEVEENPTMFNDA